MERSELGMDFVGCLGGFLGEIGIFSDRYERVWGEMGLVVGGWEWSLVMKEREVIGFGRKIYDVGWILGFLINFM